MCTSLSLVYHNKGPTLNTILLIIHVLLYITGKIANYTCTKGEVPQFTCVFMTLITIEIEEIETLLACSMTGLIENISICL